MTKERAKEMWGEMGLVGKSISICTLIALTWAGLTAAKTSVETWLVPRSEMEVRDDSLRAYLYRRDSTQAIWLIEDRVWKAEMKAEKHRECVRHHGERSCLPTD
jgi:hypothetical protein